MIPCPQTLKGYEKTCEDKKVVGGVKTEVYIATRDSFDWTIADGTSTPTAFTLDTDKNVITNMTLEQGKKWYKYEFDKNTAVLNSEYQYDSVSGEKAFCQNNLTLIFRRMDAPKRLAITSLLNSEVVVAVKDNNGTAYFMGYEEYVSSTSASFTTGTAKTDSNGTTIVLSDTTADLPLQINDAAWKAIETSAAGNA